MYVFPASTSLYESAPNVTFVPLFEADCVSLVSPFVVGMSVNENWSSAIVLPLNVFVALNTVSPFASYTLSNVILSTASDTSFPSLSLIFLMVFAAVRLPFPLSLTTTATSYSL